MILMRSTQTGHSVNSKMDANDMLSDITSGHENGTGAMSKKQFLSDLFVLL